MAIRQTTQLNRASARRRAGASFRDSIDVVALEFINLDIQGTELHALRGLGHRLKDARVIYSEVNVEDVYQDCATLSEMDEWLKMHAFARVDIQMTRAGWGDALWLRSDSIPPRPWQRRWTRKLHAIAERARRQVAHLPYATGLRR